MALAATGCGGASGAGAGLFAGSWQRVKAGAPDPDATLRIAVDGDRVSLAFADLVAGTSQTTAGTVEDGCIICTILTRDTVADVAPGSDAAAQLEGGTDADVQLSLDENGRLVVDLVLEDGTLEPIWVYQRAGEASPGSR